MNQFANADENYIAMSIHLSFAKKILIYWLVFKKINANYLVMVACAACYNKLINFHLFTDHLLLFLLRLIHLIIPVKNESSQINFLHAEKNKFNLFDPSVQLVYPEASSFQISLASHSDISRSHQYARWLNIMSDREPDIGLISGWLEPSRADSIGNIEWHGD